MMTRRGPERVEEPFASGARSITNKSDGAMAIQSLAGAASAISPGDGIGSGSGSDAAAGRMSDAAAIAASNRCFMATVLPRPIGLRKPCQAIRAPLPVRIGRSEEQTSELQSLMRDLYAAF